MELTDRLGAEMRIRQSSGTRQSEDRLDFLHVLYRLWKQKFLIAFLTVLFMIPLAYVILNLRPMYRAEAQVMIDDRKTQLLGVPDIVSSHLWSEAAVLSEVQVLSSRDLAKSVIKSLNLYSGPGESRSSEKTKTWKDHFGALIQQIPGVADVPLAAKLFPPSKEPSQGIDNAADDNAATDEFLASLTVLPTGRSNILRVQFDSSSPKTAALVANTLVAHYLADQVQRKVTVARSVTDWIEGHLEELRTKSEQARMAKEKYILESGLFVNDRNSTINTQQLSDLARELSNATTRENVAEARLASVTAAKASGTAGSATEVIASPEMQFLREQQSSLQQKIVTLQGTYGSGHPLVAQAEAQLRDVRRGIAEVAARVLQSLSSDVVREKLNIARLQTAMEAMKEQVGKANAADAKLATLDHDVTANDAMYTMFLDRVKQTRYQQGTQEPDAVLVSRADPPRQAYFPKTGLLLLLSGLTSCVTSAGIAMLFDHRKKTFQAADQVRLGLGAEVLGIVPLVKRLGPALDARRVGNQTIVGAPFNEAIRNVQVRLMISSLASGLFPHSVAFASASPGEGKSTSAVAFAIAASTRRRVVIVDCDTRRPQIHTAFQVQRGPGLTDYLEGASIDEVIQSVSGYSIDVITSGRPVPHPADLLGTDAMRSLLVALGKRYDCVVIDTPPVLAVPDALVVVPFVDTTVLMVQWRKTPQVGVERALGLLTEAGAKVAGIVLSRARLDKIATDPEHVKYYSQVEV